VTSNIVQQLIETRIEHPVEDVQQWVDQLTTLGDEIVHTRNVDPQLLTDREAEVLVRYYGVGQKRSEVAEAMGVSPNRVDNLRYAAEDDLLAAEKTVDILYRLRNDVRPTHSN